MAAQEISFAGTIDEFRRHCLLHGLDEIGLTMQRDQEIAQFEAHRSATFPWLDGPGYANTLL